MGPSGRGFEPRHSDQKTQRQSRFSAVAAVFRPDRQELQLNHIFANRSGHLSDTPENRQKIIDLTNDNKNSVGTDKHNIDWYASTDDDGSQLWAKVHNNTISDAGKNNSPIKFDTESGLNNNPKKDNTWRKKKNE